MRLVFFGTGGFAVPILRALSRHVVLVVSQPDRRSGRGMGLKASPVKEEALTLRILVETPPKCKDPEFIESIRKFDADVLVVASYGQILPEALLVSAKRGAINLHVSVLPKFRGAAPVQRAILAGETKTGVTLMQMDRGLDTGDIIAIEETPIGPDETFTELQTRLAAIAAGLAEEWMPRIVEGNYPRIAQSHGNATFAPKVEKAEAQLEFGRDAAGEYNRYRAFTESPGAFLETRFGRLRISRMRPSELRGPPGEVASVKPALVVGFADGALEICEIRPEGKKSMSGRDLANGWRLQPGMSLLP